MNRARVLVLGNGGFGHALALHAAVKGHEVALWGHDEAYTREIAANRENPRYLPGIPIPVSVRILTGSELPGDPDLVLIAVPTRYLRDTLGSLRSHLPSRIPLISCAKGMEEGTCMLPTRILEDLGFEGPLFALSGPCHAEEFARGLPVSQSLAGEEGEILSRIQAVLSGPSFRLYRNHDLLGVELAGALKNIIAIAAGICDGLGLGDNAKAALLTRGLHEMSIFGTALGARRETFFGLAGMGDLITTSVSPHGRNRALGEAIGRGQSPAEVLASTRKVAEGVWTCRAVLSEARTRGLEMPIAEAVALVLFEGGDPAAAVRALMTRELRRED